MAACQVALTARQSYRGGRRRCCFPWRASWRIHPELQPFRSTCLDFKTTTLRMNQAETLNITPSPSLPRSPGSANALAATCPPRHLSDVPKGRLVAVISTELPQRPERLYLLRLVLAGIHLQATVISERHSQYKGTVALRATMPRRPHRPRFGARSQN